jgi:copper resistance protein C
MHPHRSLVIARAGGSSPRASRARAHRAYGLLLASLLALAVALLVPATASAHATPDHSTPAPNATVQTAPATVTIHFLEDVNPNGSDITVYDAHGKVVSSGPAQVSATDAKAMSVSMKGDDSETYLVVWHTVSADDGDPDIGSYSFFVSAATATSTTQPGAGSASSGMPIWLGILLGIAGLAAGAAGGVVFARRSLGTAGGR